MSEEASIPAKSAKELLLELAERLAAAGEAYLEEVTEDKKAELKAIVVALVPGTAFDEIAWGVVESKLPEVFAALKALIAGINPDDGVDVKAAVAAKLAELL